MRRLVALDEFLRVRRGVWVVGLLVICYLLTWRYMTKRCFYYIETTGQITSVRFNDDRSEIEADIYVAERDEVYTASVPICDYERCSKAFASAEEHGVSIKVTYNISLQKEYTLAACYLTPDEGVV